MERRVTQSRIGAGQSKRNVTGLTGGRRGRRDAERDGRLRDGEERLKLGGKEDYWGGPGRNLMMNFAPKTPSSPLFTVPHSQYTHQRRLRGMRKVEERSERAERQPSGRKEKELNMQIYIPIETQTPVVKTFCLQSIEFATGEENV